MYSPIELIDILNKDDLCEERSDLLLHFTSVDAALSGIWNDQYKCSFKLGSSTKANDLADAEKDLGHLTIHGRDKATETQVENVFVAIQKLLSGHVFLGSFCRASRDLNNPHAQPVLWSRYAKRDTGLAIVFSAKQVIEVCRETFGDRYRTGRVVYGERPAKVRARLNAEEIEDSGSIERLVRNLFFEKHPDWKYEKEWRIVTTSDLHTPPSIDLTRAVRGIVLGARVPSAYDASFAWQVGIGVPILRLRWDPVQWAYTTLSPLPDKLYSAENAQLEKDGQELDAFLREANLD